MVTPLQNIMHISRQKLLDTFAEKETEKGSPGKDEEVRGPSLHLDEVYKFLENSDRIFSFFVFGFFSCFVK